ncbi:MAG TPA: ring-cleaving dioxygenase [Ktedonobacterales bacterium]|jgi:glyoxalase family protein|nr:ring-cleaving dioxygenase [Ktedonobacterales bacterium]
MTTNETTARVAPQPVSGLHHVTAIASDPQRNLDFYTGLLGLRLVKLTVNFDDPGAYHFYYGDALGRPGTILTFFSWPGAQRGRIGAGQTSATALAIPTSALDFWAARLRDAGVAITGPEERGGQPTIRFSDPDGLALELIGSASATERAGWDGGPINSERAIRGLHSVTLYEAAPARTTALLTQTMGLRQVEETPGGLLRFAAGEGGAGQLLDVVPAKAGERGLVAVGTVHHVAWRTPDDPRQIDWRRELLNKGLNVSPVMDRTYFHSIYYREPGGVLFEIATDAPGFAVDEPAETLGQSLRLPPWLETHRALIEQSLPPVRLPGVATRDAGAFVSAGQEEASRE